MLEVEKSNFKGVKKYNDQDQGVWYSGVKVYVIQE